ncbi:MAG: hypothetical protein M0D57_20550 [Sphingobacteriales bacterium JAD_PAG50586_3]|nr:MAG: hypothetical protein M0D57_20550 [Sphingobacteriales bacterium JAD_PAG50586_3]
MKNTITIVIIIICVIGCYQVFTKVPYSNDDVHYPHIAQETYGDSLRIEYELIGDTLITHYIDLKVGGEEDADDSYDKKSVLGIYKNNVALAGPYYSFKEEGYLFTYNKKDLLQLCDSMIALKEDSWTFRNIRDQVEPPVLQAPSNRQLLPISFQKHISSTDYTSIFHFAGGSTYHIDFTHGTNLLKYLPCKFYDADKHKMPEAIVIEQFENYFEGKNYYIIYDYLTVIKIDQNKGAMM